MADGGFPNRNRADNALKIYLDAMREYVALILKRAHGSDWADSQLLTEQLKRRSTDDYERLRLALKAGKVPQHLIDFPDLSRLIDANRKSFTAMRNDDFTRVHSIRDLRNELQHFDQPDDCSPDLASAIVMHCTRTLKRCSLHDAVERIEQLTSMVPTNSEATSEVDQQEQRDRDEWEKNLSAGDLPSGLTPYELRRLIDAKWEQELARRKEADREREQIAQIADDIDGLRGWFDADPTRSSRHEPEYAELQQRERQRLEEEWGEISELHNGLRRWFEADEGRRQRHELEFATLTQRELAQREQREIAGLGEDLDALHRWFEADEGRRQRYELEFATLTQRELAQREQREIAGFGEDLDALRRWFDADPGRQERHTSEHEALLLRQSERVKQEQREQGAREAAEPRRHERAQAEIATASNGPGALRRWFAADRERRVREQAEITALVQRATTNETRTGEADLTTPSRTDPRSGFVLSRSASPVAGKLGAGAHHSIALRKDGTVAYWGNSDHGRRAAPQGRFVAVSAGGSHSIALREDGTVACWGNNDHGRCDAPQGRFVAVSAGGSHSIALREDGTVACWGNNDHGRCDALQGRFVAVSAGGSHSIALGEDGTVACWGNNGHGRCDAPQERFVAVSAGDSHSIALGEDGTVACWGNNGHGRCDAPQERFVAVSAGRLHSIALGEDGTVACWGNNGHGRCDAPQGRFVAVSAGDSHSIALGEDGTVACWGNNGRGQCAVPPGLVVR